MPKVRRAVAAYMRNSCHSLHVSQLTRVAAYTCRSLHVSQLTRVLMLGGAAGWDAGVAEASDIYGGRMHNLFCDNCHSHVATALGNASNETLSCGSLETRGNEAVAACRHMGNVTWLINALFSFRNHGIREQELEHGYPGLQNPHH